MNQIEWGQEQFSSDPSEEDESMSEIEEMVNIVDETEIEESKEQLLGEQETYVEEAKLP